MKWQQALANLKAATGRTCIKQGKVITVYTEGGPFRIGVAKDGSVNADQYNEVLEALLPKVPPLPSKKLADLRPGAVIRHSESGTLFSIVATDGKKATGVALLELTSAEGWELVS